MSYSPVSVGHTARETPKTVAQGDISELLEKAEQWLEKEGSRELWALELTKGMTVSHAAAGHLANHPLLRQKKNYEHLGIFISTLWNERCDDKVIVYPHDAPIINGIGANLPREKALIITGRTGRYAGHSAYGPVILAGEAEKYFVQFAHGTVIIAGRTGIDAGVHTGGTVIAPVSTKITHKYRGRYIPKEEYEQNFALKEYVTRMIALAKKDPFVMETAFGDGVAITAAINELVGGAK